MRQGLPTEQVEQLRALYDAGTNKNQAHVITGIAEATIYRYYHKWAALTSKTAFDLEHLKPNVKDEFEYAAKVRGISVYALVAKVLNNVATDNLFAAVVDTKED